ncbi:MAG: TolC family protein [Acidobacteria bacterium]|nr:TolC family protein [Acidobacteriota bacterium]
MRTLRVLLLVIPFLGAALSASGQTPSPPPALSLTSIGTQQPAAPAGPVRRLSVEEAVALALEQNLSIQVQRLDPQVQDLSVAQARAAWTPNVSTTFSMNQRTDQNTGFLSGGVGTEKIGTDRVSTDIGFNQLLPWRGGSFNLNWNSARRTTDSIFDDFNPSLSSFVTASYVQPLLRNASINTPRQQLLVSQRNREMSDIDLRQTVLTTVRNVRNAYWELSYAISSLEVNHLSLDLARQLLKDNRARVEIGTLAPLDIIAAEAEVAQREEAVIVAETAVEQAEDRLRALIFDPQMPMFWTTRLELTDRPSFQAKPIDIDRAVREALDKRTDLRQTKKTIEVSDINIRYFRNQIMPDVNLQMDYTVRGTGGTRLEPLRGLPTGPISRSVIARRGYGNILSDMFTNDFPIWTLSLQVGYPIGTSATEANLARARLQYQQSQIQLKNLELQVSQQVRDAGRQVNANLKRVDTTRSSRELAERRLDAEQKKFAAGMSSSFFIFQAQRDLAQARNAELRAILDYNRSLVDFETVQEAPVSGGGISIAPAGR